MKITNFAEMMMRIEEEKCSYEVLSTALDAFRGFEVNRDNYKLYDAMLLTHYGIEQDEIVDINSHIELFKEIIEKFDL